MIELISYNIQLGKSLEKVIGWLKRSGKNPAIVCFQEFPEPKISILSELLGKTSYKFEFAPAVFKRKIQYGQLTLFRSDIVKLKSSKIIKLGESKLDSTIFQYKSHRSSLLTEFVFKSRTFLVVNVHLIWFASHKRRRNQLAATIKNLPKNLPTIIVGDYNYSIFLGRKKGLIKFMKEFGYSMAGERVATHRLWKIPQQIDYAFYKTLKVFEIKVGRIKYSDHFPILIKFGL